MIDINESFWLLNINLEIAVTVKEGVFAIDLNDKYSTMTDSCSIKPFYSLKPNFQNAVTWSIFGLPI